MADHVQETQRCVQDHAARLRAAGKILAEQNQETPWISQSRIRKRRG